MTNRIKRVRKERDGFCQFLVVLSMDEETEQVIAEVPSLGIADYATDSREAMGRLQQMVTFHLESLALEGKSIPIESDPQEEHC